MVKYSPVDRDVAEMSSELGPLSKVMWLATTSGSLAVAPFAGSSPAGPTNLGG